MDQVADQVGGHRAELLVRTLQDARVPLLDDRLRQRQGRLAHATDQEPVKAGTLVLSGALRAWSGPEGPAVPSSRACSGRASSRSRGRPARGALAASARMRELEARLRAILNRTSPPRTSIAGFTMTVVLAGLASLSTRGTWGAIETRTVIDGVPALERFLRETPDPERRRRALDRIGNLGPAGALARGVVEERLRDPSASVRREARDVLGRIGAPLRE